MRAIVAWVSGTPTTETMPGNRTDGTVLLVPTFAVAAEVAGEAPCRWPPAEVPWRPPDDEDEDLLPEVPMFTNRRWSTVACTCTVKWFRCLDVIVLLRKIDNSLEYLTFFALWSAKGLGQWYDGRRGRQCNVSNEHEKAKRSAKTRQRLKRK